MKYLALVAAATAACLVATAARAVDVCAYTVTSEFGTGCPLRVGSSVCLSAAASNGLCNATLDCIARQPTVFCQARLAPKSGPQAQCPFGIRRLGGFSCFAARAPATTRTATPVPTPTATPGIPPLGVLRQQQFRAADCTAYQLVSVDAGPATEVRVTTLAGSASGVGVCQMPAPANPGEVLSAVAGTLAPPGVLHPYNLVARTAVFMPNDAVVAFTPDAGGRLVIGSGAGAVAVCSTSVDCMNQQNVLALVGLDSASGGVPPACVASGLNAACDGSNVRDAFAFGVASLGNPPICTFPSGVTTTTTLCAAPPTDGFTLHGGESLVIVYGDLEASGFSAGVAGFDVSARSAGACTSGGVVGGEADTDSMP
jgi:hypothetical protein